MLLNFKNDLSLSYKLKKLKACDSWHSIEFPRKGKGTIRFEYEPLHYFESFNVILGDIEIEFSFEDVKIKNAESLGFKKATKNSIPHSLLHFNASDFSIWISFFAFEPYFIKVNINEAI
jgi:hypothetical protein